MTHVGYNANLQPLLGCIAGADGFVVQLNSTTTGNPSHLLLRQRPLLHEGAFALKRHAALQALIGPPQAECHQSQRYRMYKGNHLVLETSQTMPNIPFGDHFTVEVRWDVTQAPGAASQCRVQSCVSVPFSKATWWKKVSPAH